jgi:hypothetical protein
MNLASTSEESDSPTPLQTVHPSPKKTKRIKHKASKQPGSVKKHSNLIKAEVIQTNSVFCTMNIDFYNQ